MIIDCLRDDYSSQLKQLLYKKEFVVYDNVYSTSSWTIPSIVSILTGLYPSEHGVHESKHVKNPYIKVPHYIQNIMLQKILSRKGFYTYLLSAGLTSSYFGFTGFHLEYTIIPEPIHTVLLNLTSIIKQKMRSKNLSQDQMNASPLYYITNVIRKGFRKSILRKVVDDILSYMFRIPRWKLDKGCSTLLWKAKKILTSNLRKKFLLIHLVEPHEPYPTIRFEELGVWEIINDILGIVDPDVVEKLRVGYAEKVRYITQKIWEFVVYLDEKRALDNSLIIITADHGQMLGENNAILHGIHLYDELLRIPLLIHYPKTINIEITKAKKVISSTRIYDIILGIASKEAQSDEVLCSDIVFSESWGLHHDINYLIKRRGIDPRIVSFLEKYRLKQLYLENFRIRATSTDFSFIYHVDKQKIELLRGSIDEKTAQEIVDRYLSNAIKMHLRLRLKRITMKSLKMLK